MKRGCRVIVLACLLWSPRLVCAQVTDLHKPQETDAPTPLALTIKAFSDISFHVDRSRPTTASSTTSTSFGLGQLSVFLSVKLAETISLVSETALKLASDGRQAQSIELERIYIKYALTDRFRLATGRTHTALGYWNEAYHHGALLHPTVSRPEILRFGGVMPLHSLGLELSGRIPASSWDITYVANVANGRARDFSATQGALDVNRRKAVGGKVSFAREDTHSFIFGPMIYQDVIPSDPSRKGREGEVNERIVGAHFVYRHVRSEIISEYFRIHHMNRLTEASADHDGWYAIGVLKPSRWKPYVGIDHAQFQRGDAYFAGGDTSVRRYLVGTRYDMTANNAVKLEFRNEHRVAGVTNAFVINTAFGF